MKFHETLKHVDQKRGAVLIVHFLLKTLLLYFPSNYIQLWESTNTLFAEIDVKIGLQNVDEVSRSTFMH